MQSYDFLYCVLFKINVLRNVYDFRNKYFMALSGINDKMGLTTASVACYVKYALN